MLNDLSLFGEDIKRTFLFHIPHSSINIPNYDHFIDDIDIINKELILSTDIATDQIFIVDGIKCIVCNFSRLYCDVERFVVNEPMDKFGRGLYYTKTTDNTLLRTFDFKDYNHVYESYYRKYHNDLNKSIANILNNEGIVRIVDCHSYNENRLYFESDSDRPDICIGVDEFHTPQYLINIFKLKFESFGFSVGINTPYSGTFVPCDYYQQNKNVESIMIEINKRTYMVNDSIVIPNKVQMLINIISSVFNF